MTIFLAVCFATLGFAPPQVTAGEGEKAYAREDYLKASEHYREALKDNPRDPILNYNFGTTAYKNNLFDQAAASFTEALNSADLQLQQKAYFNLGNAYFRLGELGKAIRFYEKARVLIPRDEDLNFNLSLRFLLYVALYSCGTDIIVVNI